MAVTVDEMKNYLRVDFEDDDALIGDLIRQGKQICMDVTRIADADVGMTVTVRYCKKTAGIRSVTHRILFRDQVYDIVSVDHLNYKKKCLKFTCRKVRR